MPAVLKGGDIPFEALQETAEGIELLSALIEKESLRRGKYIEPEWIKQYKDNVCDWICENVWTYDPRLEPEQRWQRFLLFPKQKEMILWMDERKKLNQSGLIEKSRGVGATWGAVAWSAHQWLTVPDTTIGFGSSKLELVDRLGDPRSILEKVRLLLRRLPHEQLPKGWDWNKHAGLCRIINPANGSIIIGEGGDQIGRGSRTGIYFIDEAMFLEHPEMIEGSLSETTNVRIDISTVNRASGPFYRKRFSGTVPVFTFHWRDDPRRDEEWAVAKRDEVGPIVFASEYDIDYTASVAGILIPASWIRAAQGLELKWQDGTPYEAGGEKIGGFDIGEASNTFLLRRGPVVESIQQWSGELSDAVWKAITLAEEAGCPVIHYDANGPGSEVPNVLKKSERKTLVRMVGINGALTASNTVLDDGRRAKEVYANVRAECWWVLRRRFRLVWEHVEEGAAHPPDEMISIPPELAQLAVELSVPLMETRETGKVALESKQKMAVRGVASPHSADALALTYAIVPMPASARWEGVIYQAEELP